MVIYCSEFAYQSVLSLYINRERYSIQDLVWIESRMNSHIIAIVCTVYIKK